LNDEARIDVETRSDVDLKKHGSARYFASPHWKQLIMRYSIAGGPLQRWTYTTPECPADLADHIRKGGYIRAFNANFERQALDEQAARFGWPRPDVDRYRCTAAEAAAMALPRSLEGVGTVLGLSAQKDKIGAQLIKQFSMPRRRLKADGPGDAPIWNEPEDFPEDFEKFVDYCGIDVLTEEAAAKRIYPLAEFEQRLYTLDQIINSRGLRVDLESVHAAMAMAEKAKQKLDAELHELTGGAVRTCSQAAALTKWVRDQFVDMPSAAKADIADLLELEDLPSNVRRALEIRQTGAKSSTAKLEAFVKRASADGRVRHAFIINAASTARWSSRGVQLHNMPRPRKEYGDAHLDLDVLFDCIRTGDPAVVEFMYGPKLGQPLPLLSDSLKSFITADTGKELVVADYSGIEGAVAAWAAGEDWKLDAMRAILADSSKPDLYMLAASGIYGETIGKKDPRRQIGKVSELSLQYEGGVGAFFSMARNYNLKLEPVYEPVWAAADEDRREKAEKRYERCLRRREAKADVLSRKAWIACELVKIGWRSTHPAIVNSWELLRDAIRDAVLTPGMQTYACFCTYKVVRGFLWCRLPSGRTLAYAGPRVQPTVWFRPNPVVIPTPTGWREEACDLECIPAEQGYARQRDGEGKVEREGRPNVTALGVNSVTLAFERFALYGGLAFDNIVQAIARDLLAWGIVKSEEAGYPVIGHVHDEIITEVPRGFGDVAAFEALICELPEWAKGLPLGASGFRSTRYKKD
jgi:DNA polymerase